MRVTLQPAGFHPRAALRICPVGGATRALRRHNALPEHASCPWWGLSEGCRPEQAEVPQWQLFAVAVMSAPFLPSSFMFSFIFPGHMLYTL